MNFIIITARSIQKTDMTIIKASKSQMAGHFNTNTGTTSVGMLEHIKDAIMEINALNRITSIQAVHELNMPDPNNIVVPAPATHQRQYDAVFVDASHLGNDLTSLSDFLPGTPKIIMMAQPQSKYKYDYLQGDDYIFAHKNLSTRKIKSLILQATSYGKTESFEHAGFKATFIGGRVADVTYNEKSLKPRHENSNSYLPTSNGLSEHALEMTAYMIQALARKVPVENVVLEYAVRNEDHSLANLSADDNVHSVKVSAVSNLLAMTQREFLSLGQALPAPMPVMTLGAAEQGVTQKPARTRNTRRAQSVPSV